LTGKKGNSVNESRALSIRFKRAWIDLVLRESKVVRIRARRLTHNIAMARLEPNYF